MAQYENSRQVFTIQFQHAHSKLVTEVLEFCNLGVGDLTEEEHRILTTFDASSLADVALAALIRKRGNNKKWHPVSHRAVD